MSKISQALANGWHDRAFVLAELYAGSKRVAAAFLLESGVPLDELPIAAKRAIADARSEAA